MLLPTLWSFVLFPAVVCSLAMATKVKCAMMNTEEAISLLELSFNENEVEGIDSEETSHDVELRQEESDIQHLEGDQQECGSTDTNEGGSVTNDDGVSMNDDDQSSTEIGHGSGAGVSSDCGGDSLVDDETGENGDERENEGSDDETHAEGDEFGAAETPKSRKRVSRPSRWKKTTNGLD